MNEVILKINQTHDMFEADKLHSELRILDWIFYHVCKDEHKVLSTNLSLDRFAQRSHEVYLRKSRDGWLV